MSSIKQRILSLALAALLLGALVALAPELLEFLKYDKRPILVEEPFEKRVSLFGFIGPRHTPTDPPVRFRAAGFEWVKRAGEPYRGKVFLWYTDSGDPCLFEDEHGCSQWNPTGGVVEHEWYNPQTGASGPVPAWQGKPRRAPWLRQGLPFEEWWLESGERLSR